MNLADELEKLEALAKAHDGYIFFGLKGVHSSTILEVISEVKAALAPKEVKPEEKGAVPG